MVNRSITQEKKIIDNIKALALDMINNAGSGHPGIVLGAAPILYTLYSRYLNINNDDDKWINRDRFVMSAGHGSALLYATLYMAGFKISLEDLKNFRRIEVNTPGHPEYGVTPGVDMTTGPLGQGFATSVGMAIGECYLSSLFNQNQKSLFKSNLSLFDYYTYVLCSDGDLMEGVSYEAASLAGTLKLNKLIVLYDSNDVCLDGKTNTTFTENVLKRFEALGWHAQLVKDGDNIQEIDRAISKAKKVDKPSLIEIKTIIGKGSLLEGSNEVHGKPLTAEDISQLKTKLGIRDVPFSVSREAFENFNNIVKERTLSNYKMWNEMYEKYLEKISDLEKQQINSLIKNDLEIKIDLPKLVWDIYKDMKEPMRDTNCKIMNVISDNVFNFIGGSADVATSTKTFLAKSSIFSANDYTGKNICFGVREHAMGAILNGLALSGFKVFGSTFLTFADYLKPAIRLASLMNLPVTYIFTHDSINIGSDGPTHQPIEQLVMLRSTPNLDVYRPADPNEIVGCWHNILKNNNPSALVLSRNEVSLLKSTSIDKVKKGAYIVRREKNRLNGILIATGTEVTSALIVAEKLEIKGIDLRVISMPCVEKFLEQPPAYIEELLPVGYKKVVIEASSSLGWFRFVYNENYLMTIDKFGKSGTQDEVLKYGKLDE